jgi:hypothetical protein
LLTVVNEAAGLFDDFAELRRTTGAVFDTPKALAQRIRGGWRDHSVGRRLRAAVFE